MEVHKKNAVVIPFYKSPLSQYEKIALSQCLKVLVNHPVIAIKPHSLDLSILEESKLFLEIKSFDNSFFSNIDGYNRLMLSSQFYQSFLNYEFILIHQLDAFVFKDELDLWSGKGYDYIGAPWIRPIDDPDVFKTVKTKFQNYFHKRYNVYKNGLPSAKQFENQVGNGGFSLRRVSKFFELSLKFADKIQAYNVRQEHQFHEDAFWSIEVNRKEKLLKIPPYKVALHFAFENSPERAYRLIDNQLPFGCHAWDKYPVFWKLYINPEGCNLLPLTDKI